MFSYSRNYIVKECDQSVVALLNLTLYTATFSSCSGPLIKSTYKLDVGDETKLCAGLNTCLDKDGHFLELETEHVSRRVI